MILNLGEGRQERFGRKRAGAASDGSHLRLHFLARASLVLRTFRRMPRHVQLVVIRQANGAVVLRPCICFRSVVVPRGIPDPLLELLRLPSVLAIRSRRALDRLAPSESLVFLVLENFPVMVAWLRSSRSFLVGGRSLAGNHVAGYYPSGAVNLSGEVITFVIEVAKNSGLELASCQHTLRVCSSYSDARIRIYNNSQRCISFSPIVR